MPRRYTCHLYFVDLPDGRIKVTYDDPGRHFIARPVDLIGSEPLTAPDEPQTQEEHDEWLFGMLSPNGSYTMRISSRAMDLPPIEEEDVPDDLPEGSLVRVRMEAYQRPRRPKTLLVVVQNTGNVPVPKLSVHWTFSNETPQPVQLGSIPAAGLGGSLRLETPSAFKGTLRPGQEISFLLGETFLQSMLGQIAALSPERYGIVVVSGELEVGRIEGNKVGDFLEKLDAKPVTYEFVPPECDEAEDPESQHRGFSQLKEEYPSLELFTITCENFYDSRNPMKSFNFIHSFTCKVNACTFEGKFPGTVMFAGANSSSGTPIAKLFFLYRPEGWNKVCHPETGQWEEVVFAATGKPRYESVDFTPLTEMRVKGWH